MGSRRKASSRTASMTSTMSLLSSNNDTEVTVQMTDGSRKSLKPIAQGLPRKSVKMAEHNLEGLGIKQSELLDNSLGDEPYDEVLAQARCCVGHGQDAGAFPEEWDAQLLLDLGCTDQGVRVLLFTPAFLKYCVEDDAEMDQAFKFVLLRMDPIATSEKYIFVWCCQGIDLTHSKVAQRLRLAYNILPKSYSRNLKKLVFLHVNASFRVMMWTMWPWITTRMWEKIEYVDSIEKVCADLHKDGPVCSEMQRRFPLMVQREDARRLGREPLPAFGVPAEQVAVQCGVDFTDKTTGRHFSRLPPPVIFLCEMLERQAGQLAFSSLFSADAVPIYDLILAIDEGEAIDPDTPLPALWCALKLFLDCLPSPLLSYEAFLELTKRKIDKEDVSRQLDLLKDLLRFHLPRDTADMTLYVASFLHTMCQKTPMWEKAKKQPRAVDNDDDGSDETESTQDSSEEEVLAGNKGLLTPVLAGQVFAPSFIRPRSMDAEALRAVPVAEALVVTLIRHAEDPYLKDREPARPASLQRVPSPKRQQSPLSPTRQPSPSRLAKVVED